MKKILLVVGTRPNLVKAAALLAAMDGDPRFKIQFVHTGQHFDDNMSDSFFRDLHMRDPDVHLGVSVAGAVEQIAQILLRLESVIQRNRPDWMVVVGDVTSTLAAALAANKLGIPLAHVEAGLRSFDWSMPEEINRRITDMLSDVLFTTCREAEVNLLHEGIPGERIHFVGNVMVDTLLRNLEQAKALQSWKAFNLPAGGYALLTLHRPSNVDQPAPLEKWVRLLAALQAELPVVFPVHPRTRQRMGEFGLLEQLERMPKLHLAPPLGYLDFLSLMAEARVVLTDSGGIQEETTVLGAPWLTLRANTERPVTITDGSSQLVGVELEAILAAVGGVLKGKAREEYRVPELWDGRAAYRIAEILAGGTTDFEHELPGLG